MNLQGKVRGDEVRVKDTVKNIIVQEVIKNLLSAHKRIAETGNAKGVICISKHLLYLAKKFNNVVIEIPTKEIQEEEKYPPDCSSQHIA